MPRFFNRIRKKLAKENKFFQYSRYAIGEILLVVIGILIAFQVDNWNEDRKRNIDRDELVNSLTQEFKNQIEILEARIKIEEDEVRKINDAIKMIEHKDITIPIDSLKSHISVVFYQTGEFISFQKYEMAINSGRISLIDDDDFDHNIAVLLQRYNLLNRMREEHLTMAFSGPLLEIKEQRWEVFKPFENRLNGTSQDDKDYLDFIGRPEVIARIKNAFLLKNNILNMMKLMVNTSESIVENFEAHN